MYAAKAGGGNCITVARGPGGEPLALADHDETRGVTRVVGDTAATS